MSEATDDLFYMRESMQRAGQARSAWLARIADYQALSMAEQYEARQQGISTELGALREAFHDRCYEVFSVLDHFHPELAAKE